MSRPHPQAHINGGFIMQDLLLKLEDMDLNSCWLTFASSEEIKEVLGIDSELDVVAIAAFGYGKKTTRLLRLNFRSMSDVDIQAKYRYMEPKRAMKDMVFVDSWGNNRNLDRYIGFFDDMLWEALYAATLAPSYLNRQAYGFILHGGNVSLIRRPDSYNTPVDGDLSLGAVLLHFTAVAEEWLGKLKWDLSPAFRPDIPVDHDLIATASV
jgi:hypothetical protein